MHLKATTSKYSYRIANFNSTRQIDLICFSHLRWNFVYQRPQHLLSRAAKHARAFFFEEPIFYAGPAELEITPVADNLYIVVPKLPHGIADDAVPSTQRVLLDRLLNGFDISNYIAWYYTPMALQFTRHLRPNTCVYDCMDQLANFKFAPTEMEILEAELMRRAQLIFTGGHSLYEAKKALHPAVYPFPSSVDVGHFFSSRSSTIEPEDQQSLARPRIGYIGVIDERIDLRLIESIAKSRPGWQVIMIGPVVKIDAMSLPRLPNIHYLGQKAYDELPNYLAGWDVAIMPFARNEATKYISPTKTPEYLSAGRRVVSTSIRDVVKPYGELGLVGIADCPESFIAKIEKALDSHDDENWRRQVDRFLSKLSWDHTFSQMWELIADSQTIVQRTHPTRTIVTRKSGNASDSVYYGAPN
jgi:UDP-galactopyranose mutase